MNNKRFGVEWLPRDCTYAITDNTIDGSPQWLVFESNVYLARAVAEHLNRNPESRGHMTIKEYIATLPRWTVTENEYGHLMVADCAKERGAYIPPSFHVSENDYGNWFLSGRFWLIRLFNHDPENEHGIADVRVKETYFDDTTTLTDMNVFREEFYFSQFILNLKER